MENAISEILLNYGSTWSWEDDVEGKFSKEEALTAIYEIGLEAIPKTYEPMWKGHDAVIWKDGYETCRAEFLKAWAKACGVAE